MVFKCCVINCRTNYDTQPKKYPVFAFPSQSDLRKQWIEKIQTKSQKITHSSRVCVRHFNPDDIKMSNKQRSILMPNAVPVGNYHVIESETETEDEEIEETTEIVSEDFIEEATFTFEDFCGKVEETQDSIVEDWNIYNHPNAICFYRLANLDGNFEKFNITVKVIVSNNLQVQLFNGEAEASSKELSWALNSPHLHSWEQFEQVLDYYRQEPEILYKKQPVKDLQKACELLDRVIIDELDSEIEAVRLRMNSILKAAQELGQLDEDDASDEGVGLKNEIYVEALEEAAVTVSIDSGSHFDVPMDGMEEIVVDVALKTKKEDEDVKVQFRCPNCHIVCMSDMGLKFHLRSCRINENHKIKIPVKKFPKKSSSESHDSSKVRKFGVRKTYMVHPCSICGKVFRSPHTQRDHEKTHKSNPELEKYLVTVDGRPRYTCPNCGKDFEFSFILKKHIDGKCLAYEKKRKYRYPCAYCDRQFVTKTAASKHLDELHEVKIACIEKWCFECNAEFEDYVNHVRMHSCNFACRYCGAKFLTEEKAMNHQIEKHSHETDDDRQFKCPEDDCELSFKNINHLKSHQQSIHCLAKKEYQCDLCAKTFAQRSLLNAHARTHMNLAMFPCNFAGCERRFKKLNNLKEHSQREHGDSSIYLCGIDSCEVRFKMLQELKVHRLEQHQCAFNIQKYFDNESF